MDDQFDTSALMARVSLVAKQIRWSDAYPAVLGGIAGGIAGALMAALIAGRIAAPRAQDAPLEKESPRFAWSLRDVMQLATVAAGLAKQVQAWSKERGRG